MDAEIEKLLDRLAQEEKSLEMYGYRFPALYDAIKYLLQKQMAH